MLDKVIDDILGSRSTVPNIIEFIESKWGWNQKMFPTQKFMFKVIYGLPLDTTERVIRITDKFNDHVYDVVSEADYFKFLVSEGRISASEPSDKPYFEIIEVIGRRGSKSAMASFQAGYELFKLLVTLKDPHSHYGITATDEIRIVVVGSDKGQASVIFNQIKEGSTNSEVLSKYVSNDTKEKIFYHTQHQLEQCRKMGINPKDKKGLISAFVGVSNARSARGTGSIVIIMDEMAFFMNSAGARSDKAVYDALTPAVSAFGLAGKIVAISSPMAKVGQFYDMYNGAMESPDDKTLAVRIPTWGMNHTIDSDFLRDRFKKMGAISYGCEYGANFSDSKNVWLEDENLLLNCINPNYQEPKMGKKYVRYYHGLDLGQKNDAFAIGVSHKENNKVIVDYKKEYYASPETSIFASDRYYEFTRKFIENPQFYKDMVMELVAVNKRFPCTYGMLDQWSGLVMQQAMSEKGLRNYEVVHFTDSLNSQIYALWRIIMANNEFEFADDEGFVKQVLLLEQEVRSKGIIIISGPQKKGYHDDLADAVARSIWAALKGSPNAGKGGKKQMQQVVTSGSTGTRSNTNFSNSYGNYLKNKNSKYGGRYGRF